MRMHDGEVDIDAELVRRLVAAQFPRLAHLPIRAVHPTGTVNAIYRLGGDLCVRLPRMQDWADDLDKEGRLLPLLAPGLPLRVPEPFGTGHPSDSYPLNWAIYHWIDGEPYADQLVADEERAGADLAGFVLDLRGAAPVADAPHAGRKPLAELDAITRAAIESAGDAIDAAAVTAAWDRALEAPRWEGTPVWIHTDLLRPNLLVRDGRLRAVIDWGGAGVGDPAADVIAAWSVFGRSGRKAFRDILDVDDDTWNRARGFALHQAALIIPYYRVTNPGFVTMAKRTIDEVLADLSS